MARSTFNRKPSGVNTPNSSNIQQAYFNHINWKGINQNRNFLIVDPETFVDAQNVYVDDDGLLKSRLPLRFNSKYRNILDIKILDDLIFYLYDNGGSLRLGVSDGEKAITSISVNIDGDPEYSLKLCGNGEAVYIFTKDKVYVYNKNKTSFSEVSFFIPITRIYASNDYENFDDINMFSTMFRYQYILQPTLNGNKLPDIALGKQLVYTHEIDGDKISHLIDTDENGSFFNSIHMPLISTTTNFYRTNTYGVQVNTVCLHDGFMYRYVDGTLQRASLSEKLFEDYFVETVYSYQNFVKIRVFDHDVIAIIYSDAVRKINLATGQISADSLRHGSTVIVDYFEKYYDDEYLQIGIGLSNYSTEEGDLSDEGYLFLQGYNSKKAASNINYQGASILKLTDVGNVNTFKNILIANTDCSIAIDYTGPKMIFSVNINGGTVGSYSDIFLHQYMSWKCLYGETVRDKDDLYYKTYSYDNSNNIQKYPLRTPVNSVVTYDNISRKGFHVYGALNYSYLNTTYLVYGEVFTTGSKLTIEKSITHATGWSYFYNGTLFAKYTDGFYFELNGSMSKITNLTGVPLMLGEYWFYLLENIRLTVSNFRTSVVNLYEYKNSGLKYTGADLILKTDKIFLTKGNSIYIGEIVIDPDDSKEKLYFKEMYHHTLDFNINGIHPISNSEIALFTNGGTVYNVLSDGIFYYQHSKIVPKLKDKSEIITLSNSTTTLMPSSDGIIALNYQNFVNSTEQSTLNLTQDVSEIYKLFDGNVKNINWKNYTLFYQYDKDTILILDNRSQSWWYWKLPIVTSLLFVYDTMLYCLSNGLVYEFTNDVNEYFDKLGSFNSDIDWFIESQKLHFNANNYYKHITNLTLMSLEENEYPISMNLNVKNYRKQTNDGKAENFDYDIDIIRTFIKRLNYAKVNEFQYRLSADNDVANKSPLTLSGVTIKYKIGGQVR